MRHQPTSKDNVSWEEVLEQAVSERQTSCKHHTENGELLELRNAIDQINMELKPLLKRIEYLEKALWMDCPYWDDDMWTEEESAEGTD